MTSTENLWPETLFSDSNKGVILDLLETQAAALRALSSERLSVWITTSTFADSFAFKFMVSPAEKPDQAFELFVTRCAAGQLPCAVENYHTEPRQSGPLKALEELKTHLKRLFSELRTREILQILVDEVDPYPSSPEWPPATVARIEHTAFASDDPSIPGRLVKLRLRDLVGFLRQEDVGELLGDPDNPGTNFKLLNDDQYLMYVQFAAPVGIPISGAEIVQLQTSIKAAMSDWGTEDRFGALEGSSHPLSADD